MGGSRDFLKILRGRPRISGVSYFGPPPPRKVRPVFAELRQFQGNPTKRRKPTVREMTRFLVFAGEHRDPLQTLRDLRRIRGAEYSPSRTAKAQFAPNSDRPREIRVNGANPRRRPCGTGRDLLGADADRGRLPKGAF